MRISRAGAEDGGGTYAMQGEVGAQDRTPPSAPPAHLGSSHGVVFRQEQLKLKHAACSTAGCTGTKRVQMPLALSSPRAVPCKPGSALACVAAHLDTARNQAPK